ncbi:MAG: hypothetical protein AMQ22_01799 [Candidatus Methanofastidiosum methylothiophilum]|jgi:hypothetical protein|uniref:Uncharacterized protein n=1 Tax=Candidatus Methanofastidiosum methylothiophilum TaxID=1705564 RepID=A0A150IV93_9EURY|nr:MAG: hypothetical protein AMQ22_01799 [Candidatus Methanofastidiosum methylthiophilus]
MDKTEIAISIISTVISFIAVITAICLSIIPEMAKNKNQRKMARIRIKHVFGIINVFFEEYRFYNTTKFVYNKNVLLSYDLADLKYKIDILSMLESIKEDIILAKYSEQAKLNSIYYRCYEVFSGFPKPLLSWYILEADIVEYFKFSNESKKYWLHEKEKGIEESKLVFHCYACDKKYSRDEVMSHDDMNDVEKRLYIILGTEICKRDRIPMHLMEKTEPIDISKITY